MDPVTLYRRLIYCRTLAYQIRLDLDMLIEINTDVETDAANTETYMHASSANDETIANLNALIQKHAPTTSPRTTEHQP